MHDCSLADAWYPEVVPNSYPLSFLHKVFCHTTSLEQLPGSGVAWNAWWMLSFQDQLP